MSTDPRKEQSERGMSRAHWPMRIGNIVPYVLPFIFLCVAVGVGHISRYWRHDEAVYLSQFNTDPHLRLPWGPHRIHGILVLAGLVRWLDLNHIQGRIAVGLIISTALVGVISLWTRHLPLSIIIPGMVAFGMSWIAMLHMTALMPNLVFAAVAAMCAAMIVHALDNPTPRRLIMLGLLTALATVVRFTDAAWLVLGLTLSATLLRRRKSLPIVATVIVGGVAGIAPWVLEALASEGGLAGRIERLASLGDAQFRLHLLDYLRLTDGPQLGPDPGSLPVVQLFLLAVALTFTGRGVLRAFQRREPSVSVATIIGVILSLPYLFLYDVTAPRFMLPSMLLLSIPLGYSVIAYCTKGRAHAFSAIVLGIIFVMAQVNVALEQASDDEETGERVQEIGAIIRERASSGSCIVFAPYLVGSIGYASGCEARRIQVLESITVDAFGQAEHAFVIVPTRRKEPDMVEGWELAPVEGAEWRFYYKGTTDTGQFFNDE